MHDRARTLFGKDAPQKVGILDIAFVERHIIGHGEAEAGDEIVDHRDRMVRVPQRQHGVGADVACAAGDENGNLRHWQFAPLWRRFRCSRAFMVATARAIYTSGRVAPHPLRENYE
ncbi:hypothetical protein NJ75_01450 [Novosphingobium subterraneum]|uniref:Uncharacterized protein n=1 Tax=Novosphingobium subterraneum TaxID=48936 RepID=A0A0B9AAJ1_9SPHN|nr:hypothetical protein NJ75_01450 [Novosphingobium subterraneum]